MLEYRASGTNTAIAADFSDVSIGNFNATPWFGTGNQYLLDVAFRPGTCDEGLIVGMDNGSAGSPTFGLAVRFYDTSQTTCAP